MLYNKDCIEVMRDMVAKGVKVDCIITDPPYFVLPNGKDKDKFKWDRFKNLEEFEQWTYQWYSFYPSILKDDSFMFIFWSQKYFKLGVNIFNPARVLMWHYKNLNLVSSGDFAYDYEPIFVIKRGNPKLPKGKFSCILEYTKPQSNFKTDKLYHPTQKPIKLIEHLVSIGSKDGDVVFDPFMGSGTTGVACKNRKFIGCEIDKQYFNIAKERIEND